MEQKSNTPPVFPRITAEWPDIQTDRIEYTDPFKEGGNPIDEIWLRVSTLADGLKHYVEYTIVLASRSPISESEQTELLKEKLRSVVEQRLKNPPLIGKDSEGNELRAGDKAELIILNAGSGVVEIVTHGGVLQMYCPSQGYYPLNAALLRQDMHLEKIQKHKPMKIYKLTQCENTYYETITGFVIVANSEEEARGVAKDKHLDEGPEVWDFAETEEVGTYTGQATTPFVLMADINNG